MPWLNDDRKPGKPKAKGGWKDSMSHQILVELMTVREQSDKFAAEKWTFPSI